MNTLFDAAFFKFLLGFLMILGVSFSILFTVGLFRYLDREVAAAPRSGAANGSMVDSAGATR